MVMFEWKGTLEIKARQNQKEVGFFGMLWLNTNISSKIEALTKMETRQQRTRMGFFGMSRLETNISCQMGIWGGMQEIEARKQKSMEIGRVGQFWLRTNIHSTIQIGARMVQFNVGMKARLGFKIYH